MRHYPGGFRIAANDGLQLGTDPSNAKGLCPLPNLNHADFRYDFDSESLTVSAGKGMHGLKITRRQ
jgi:hypothetical protein